MIEINESTISFHSIHDSPYTPDDIGFRKANLLILPYQNFREGIEYCFTEYATEFLTYINNNASDEIIADIAIRDENYCCLEMHSLLLDVGIFIVETIILPAAINLLSNYIYDKIKSLHEKKENVQIRVQIVVQNEKGLSKSITFDGPASDFSQINSTVNKLLKGK